MSSKGKKVLDGIFITEVILFSIVSSKDLRGGYFNFYVHSRYSFISLTKQNLNDDYLYL